MIKRFSLTGLTLAAVLASATPALADTSATPAGPAATSPGYSCSRLEKLRGKEWAGRDNCAPRGGAPNFGSLQGTFTITGGSPPATVTCIQPTNKFTSGDALGPYQVTGYECRR